jgi:transposase
MTHHDRNRVISLWLERSMSTVEIAAHIGVTEAEVYNVIVAFDQVWSTACEESGEAVAT